MSNPLIQIPNKGDGSFGEGDQSLNKVGASYLKDASSSESLTVKSNNVISNQKINDEYLLKMDNTINQITNQKVQMVSQLQKIIKEIYHQLDQKNTTISRLEGIAKQQANNLQQQQAKIVELRNQNQRKSDELVKSNQRHNQLLKQNQKKVSQLLQLQKKVAELQTQNYQLIHQTGGKFWKFLQLDEITNKLGKTVNNSFEGIINKLTILLSQNASLNVQLQNKNEQIAQLKGGLQKRSAELSDKNVQVTQLKGQLQKRSAELSDKNDQVTQLKEQLQNRTQKDKELQKSDQQVIRLNGELQKRLKQVVQFHHQYSVIKQKLHSHQLQFKETQKHIKYFINKIIASQKKQLISRLQQLQQQPHSSQRLQVVYQIIQDYSDSLLNVEQLNKRIGSVQNKLKIMNEQKIEQSYLEKNRKKNFLGYYSAPQNQFSKDQKQFQKQFPKKVSRLKQILENYPDFKCPYLYMQNINVTSKQFQNNQPITIQIQFLNTLFLLQKINDNPDRRVYLNFLKYFKVNDNINAFVKYRPKNIKQQHIGPIELKIKPKSQKQQYSIKLNDSKKILEIIVSFKLRYSQNGI